MSMIARKLQWLVLCKAICEAVPTLSKLTPFFFLKVKRVKEFFFFLPGDRKRKKLRLGF